MAIRVGAVAFVFVLLAMAAASPAQTVDGVAVDAASGAGVAGVHVSFRPRGGSAAKSYDADTDPRGQFHIEGIGSGSYQVSCYLDGFLACVAQPYLITAGSDPVTVQLKLTPQARIAGRVLDGKDRPVPDAQVELTDERSGGRPGVQIAETDGSFVFDRLRPGSYTLLARAPRDWEAPEPADGHTLTWAPTFYPSAVLRDGAGKIQIEAGTDIAATDIKLKAVPARHIRGVVLGVTGEPAPGVSVKLAAECRMSLEEAGAQTGEDGAFDFAAVDGAWCVSAAASDGEIGLEARESVQVSGDSVDPVKLQLSRPFFIQGSIVYDPPLLADRLLKPEVRVTLSAEGRVTSEGINAGDGLHFTIDNLYKDRYALNVPGTVGNWPDTVYYLASVRLGGQEVIDDRVEISGAEPLDIRYEAHGGTVRGSVEGGVPAMIVLEPRESRWAAFKRQGQSDRLGHFEFTGVRPGSYTVTGQGVYANGTNLQPLRPAEITVGAGETVTVDLHAAN